MASEKVLDKKKVKVEQLTKELQSACAGVLFDYKGISVDEDTKLRRELREAGVIYSVEKNSMLRFALKNAGLDGFDEVLSGTTALAISTDDQTAPARVLGKFMRSKEEGRFSMKAGFVDGQFMDANRVVALSKIPPRDQLLAQLVGSLMGPMTSLAAIIKAVADKKTAEAAE